MAITPSQWSHVLTIPESYTPSSATSGQTLVITESVIAKLSASDQSTFWANVQNGGGDVRICTDAGGVNQLPVEVVSLDSVAQTCVIWTRKPSYDGTGNLYLFTGKAGETQPPVTDPFGRNAVWQDNAAVYHLSDSSGADSTGVNDLTPNGSTSDVAGVFGVAQRFDSAEDSFSGSFSGLGTSQRTLKAWVRPDNVTDNRYLSTFNGGTRQNLTALLLGFQSGNFNVFDEGYPTGNASDTQISATPAQWQRLVYVWDGAVLKGYINGVEQVSVSDTLFNQTPDFLRISPVSGGGSNFYAGALQLFEALDSAQPPEYIATEYANQSDHAFFFGTPTISETGGATGVTADITYTVSAPTFSASASVTIPAPNADVSFSIPSPQFSASASVTQPGFSADVSFLLQSPQFSASASATLPNPQADVSYEIGKPQFSASASASLPQPVADVDFSLQEPVFSASASVTINGRVADVDFSVGKPVFNASASVTLPNPVADVAFTISPPIFSVVAISGSAAIIADDETNINMPSLSTNVEMPWLSTNINR